MYELEFPVDSGVYAVAETVGHDLIIGGRFSNYGSTPMNNIARLRNGTIDKLGVGLDGAVNAIGTTQLGNGQTDIWIGGEFLSAGGILSSKIARCRSELPTSVRIGEMAVNGGRGLAPLVALVTIAGLGVIAVTSWAQRRR